MHSIIWPLDGSVVNRINPTILHCTQYGLYLKSYCNFILSWNEELCQNEWNEQQQQYINKNKKRESTWHHV